jgi:hypothetical protein
VSDGLALFTIPKAFRGAAATAQLNALGSWRASAPDAEIVLLGDEEGVAAAAAAVGALHLPEIARTEWGTPLVSDAFAAVAKAARSEALCYANADILLLPDLVEAVGRLRGRTDLAIDGEVDFGPGWQDTLRRHAEAHGQLGEENQIDYMVFPRDVDWEMPPFAVGRPAWDNWLLYRARELGLALVDATPSVLVVHQAHGYEHVPEATGPRWQGPEGDRNRALAAEMGFPYGILDATHVLTETRLLPALGRGHLKRRVQRIPVLGPRLRGLRAALRR